MEVQMAAQAPKLAGRSTPSHHHSGGAKPVPGYLRPSAGSCHHVCKYGGTHTFEDKEAQYRAQPPRPRKQQPPPVAPESRNRVLVKVRSVFRRRAGDSTRATEKASKTATGKPAGKGGEGVEWKDIVAYDTSPRQGSHPLLDDETSAQVTGSGDAKKKGVMKGKNSYGDANKISEQLDGVKGQNEPLSTITNTEGVKSLKPPKGKKPTALLVEKMAMDKGMLHGYQVLSPSLVRSRANLLRDLKKEMVHEDANVKEEWTTYSFDQEEYAAAAAESSRPIPAHRRVKSMSISSRSGRYPIARQASRNPAGAFKLRSRSTKAPVLPSEEEKPAWLRSRRVEDPSGVSTGRGIQLRIRSLRRRGVGGSGGASAGFVVPAVALRHQKTLEKKKSRRLYNNLIEETASKLVKTRKSRVKALVGAFESVISKIAK